MPDTGASGPRPRSRALLTLSVPSVILFVALLDAADAPASAAARPSATCPLAPASFARSLQGGVLLVVAVVVAVAFMDPGNVIKLGIGLAFGLICLSLVPLTGWGGYASICQLTFAGLGCLRHVQVRLRAARSGACSGGSRDRRRGGGLVSLPALRLRGLYLALSTMAFASAMDNAFFPWSAIFGFDGSVAIAKPTSFGLSTSSPKSFTIFLAVVFALFSIAILALRRGPFGRVLVAVKDSEAACATLGLSLTTTKLAVFTLSAAMAGCGRGPLRRRLSRWPAAPTSRCSRAC